MSNKSKINISFTLAANENKEIDKIGTHIKQNVEIWMFLVSSTQFFFSKYQHQTEAFVLRSKMHSFCLFFFWISDSNKIHLVICFIVSRFCAQKNAGVIGHHICFFRIECTKRQETNLHRNFSRIGNIVFYVQHVTWYDLHFWFTHFKRISKNIAVCIPNSKNSTQTSFFVALAIKQLQIIFLVNYENFQKPIKNS